MWSLGARFAPKPMVYYTLRVGISVVDSLCAPLD